MAAAPAVATVAAAPAVATTAAIATPAIAAPAVAYNGLYNAYNGLYNTPYAFNAYSAYNGLYGYNAFNYGRVFKREAEAEADPEAAYYARSLYSPYGRALPYARSYYGLGYRSYAGLRPYGLGYRSYAGLRPYGYYY